MAEDLEHTLVVGRDNPSQQCPTWGVCIRCHSIG